MILTKGNKELAKQKNGRWKEFNKHAMLVAEGHYLQDRKDGVWREYYDDGNLMFEETYKDGLMHGPFSSYHLNGQRLSEGQYNNGSREGCFKIFDESGRHIRSLVFSNNALISEVEEILDESFRLEENSRVDYMTISAPIWFWAMLLVEMWPGP